MGGAPRREPRLPDAVGADLAGRRPDQLAFRRRIRRYQREIREGTGYPFFIFSPDGDTPARRDHALPRPARHDPDRDARLLDGRALRRQGLHEPPRSGRSIAFAFDALHLHRLEAACLPHNAASMRLLEKVGFRREGYARRIVASTAAGRTICSTASSGTIRGRDSRAEALFRCATTMHFQTIGDFVAPAVGGSVAVPCASDRSSVGCSLADLGAAISAVTGAAALEAIACRSTADARPHRRGRASSTSPTTASRFRPRRAPTASCAASRCARRKAVGGSDWVVFALANPGDEQIDRLLVVPHYRLVGSGLIWPDLGAARIAASRRARASRRSACRARRPTSSASRSIPARSSPTSPSSATRGLPEIHLWDADTYEDMVNSYTLYRGVVLGHRRPARAVPERPLRRQGNGDVPRDRGARLGGARLYLHRLRLLEPGVRIAPRRRPDLARRRRGRARGVAARSSSTPTCTSTAGTSATAT